MQCLFRRFVEAILVEVALSLFAILLYLINFFKNEMLIIVVCSAFAIIYLVWTVICLFGYRISIAGKQTYYKTNLFVYSVLSLAALIVTTAIHFVKNSKLLFALKLCNSALFFPFKIFHYLGKLVGLNIGFAPSAAMFSALIFIIVLLLPVFVNKRRYLRRHWQFERNLFGD